MALIPCPTCGKPLADTAKKCLQCGHTFVRTEPNSAPQPEKKPYDRKREQEHAFQKLLAFDGSATSVAAIGNALVNYFEREYGTEGPLRHIRQSIHYVTAQIESGIKLNQKHNDAAARTLLNNLNRTMNAPSTYEGLGFSVITDTAGAVAYAALDAWEQYKHDILQNQTAYKQLAESFRKLHLLDNSSCLQGLAAEIEHTFDIIEAYWEAKAFAQEHKDFYHDDKYDLGVELGGTNIYRLLQEICASDKAYLDILDRGNINYTKLVDRGYLFSYGYPIYTVFSTGKYEKWAMEQIYYSEHPDAAKALEQKHLAEENTLRKAAQTALENKEYLRAATLFGQLYNDEEAIRLSARIWHTHLMEIPEHEYHWTTAVDGRFIDYRGTPLTDPFVTKPDMPIKQITKMDHCWISLGLDGRIWFPPDYVHDGRRLPKRVFKWSQVVSLYHSGSHLFGIHQDGHVSCESITPYEGAYIVDGLSNVKKLQKLGVNLVALTLDGKIQLAGPTREDLEICRQWENVKDIDCPYRETLIGLTEDGRVLLAGKVPDFYKPAQQWQDVVQVQGICESILGITNDGRLLQSGDPVFETDDPEQVQAVQGLVRFGFVYSAYCWYALRSDGTILRRAKAVEQCNVPANEVVGLYGSDDYLVALCKDGRMIRDGQIIDRCFENIETAALERKQVLQKLLSQKEAALKKTGLLALGKQKLLKEDIAFLQKEIAKINKPQ